MILVVLIFRKFAQPRSLGNRYGKFNSRINSKNLESERLAGILTGRVSSFFARDARRDGSVARETPRVRDTFPEARDRGPCGGAFAMTSELEALKRLPDTTSSPAPRDGASGGDVRPGEGAPKPASPLDVDAIMARFDATAGALAEESARGPGFVPDLGPRLRSAGRLRDAHVTGARRTSSGWAPRWTTPSASWIPRSRATAIPTARRGAPRRRVMASRADADAKQRALESLKETLANTRRVLEARVTAAEDAAAAAAAAARAAETRPRPPSRRATLPRRKPRRLRRAGARRGGFGGARERGGEWVRRATEARARRRPARRRRRRTPSRARERARQPRRAEARRDETGSRAPARREATRKLDKYRREYRRRQTERSAGVPGVTGAGAVEERARRDSVEAWLKEELRNREKTETLFVQLRDLALRPNENGAKIEALRGELDALRASVGKGESAS